MHRAPADLRAGASSSTTSGSSTTSSTTARSRRTSPPTTPNGSRRSRACGSTTPGSTTACRSTTAPRSSRCSPSARTAAPTVSSTPTTRTSPTSPSRPASRSTAGRTRSRRASSIDSADAEGVLYAHGGVAGGHSLYVKDKKLRYTFNWLGTKLLRHRRRHRDQPGQARASPPSSRPTGQSTDPTMPGFAGHADALRRHDEGRRGRDRHPARELLPRRATASASAATARHRSRPSTPRPSAFTGGTIDKVVVDVSGEKFVDHEAQVAAWFSID